MAKKLHITKWEMQIKATMSYHPHTINAEERVKRKDPSYTVAGNVNWYSHYGEQCGVSENLK